MTITDYQLTLRGKDGGVLATTHHPDKAAAFASLNHLAESVIDLFFAEMGYGSMTDAGMLAEHLAERLDAEGRLS